MAPANRPGRTGLASSTMAWRMSSTSNTRSKDTRDVANSTRVFDRAVSGPYRLPRYAERATMVPTVMAPLMTRTAPVQNTTAEPSAPITPSAM